MDMLATRLKERAKQLGISNAEAARRCGLDERRYAHYASGRREPDLTTLKNIAEILNTTPNWLLGIEEQIKKQPEKSALIGRLMNMATVMTKEELEVFLIQGEAIVASKDTSSNKK